MSTKTAHGALSAADNCAHSADRPRLAAQTQAIVDRLRSGAATNVELAAISLKYTSRISDARAAGYTIECTRLDGGLTEYRLVERRAPVVEPGGQLVLVMA